MRLILVAFLVLTFFIILQIVRYLTIIFKKINNLKTIPVAPSRLLINLLTFSDEGPDKHFDNLRKFAKNLYPIYRFSLLHQQIVTLLDPDDIELVLSSKNNLSKSLIYSFFHNWLGTGLLTSTGEKWHKRRKILTPAFHFKILQQFLPIFNEETTKLIEKLTEENGRVVNILSTVSYFTLQSIADTAMGLGNLGKDSQVIYKEAVDKIKIKIFERFCRPWFRINFIYRFTNLFQEEIKIIKILHEFTNNIIKEREKTMTETYLKCYLKENRLAMLDLLLVAKNNEGNIDYDGIHEEVNTFLFEGHDTTSIAISFFLLILANYQDIQTKVLNEILTVVGPTKLPTYEDLQQLKFTERCIKETLRLFPSVPSISRICDEDFVTKTGHKIPKGTTINIHIFDLHRNERFYCNPLKFDPDRFFPENINKRHPFAYLPFSAGPRNCIGQKFALLELKAVLCGILREFKFEKVVALEDIRFNLNMVLQPTDETPLKIKILKRVL